MNCPKCNQVMEEGFLQSDSRSSISWVSKLLPFGMGFLKSDAKVVSSDTVVGINSLPAHICKSCKLLIADYSDK